MTRSVGSCAYADATGVRGHEPSLFAVGLAGRHRFRQDKPFRATDGGSCPFDRRRPGAGIGARANGRGARRGALGPAHGIHTRDLYGTGCRGGSGGAARHGLWHVQPLLQKGLTHHLLPLLA